MHRLIVTAVTTLVAGVVLGLIASAQVYQGVPYNPYTGGAAPQPSYNPYTGAGAPAAKANPFTGAPAPAVNPYTGKPLPQPTAYNPLTGGQQQVQAIPTPTAPQVAQWPRGKYPVSGKAGPGLEGLDQLVQAIMGRHGIPGATLAVAKDGKLVYARGFGWADLTAATPCEPITLFGLASLSKPLTCLAILWLIEQGMLGLEDRPFDILKHIQPPPGTKLNPNLKKVTIRQLLNHTGGWDRGKSGDPVNWEPQIANAFGIPAPVSDEHFISFIMGMPLDFEPGTRMEYSNIGTVVMGRVIEKVSGQAYEAFVRDKVLKPAGMQHAFLNAGIRSYLSGEARHYLAGTSILLPPMNLPMVKAAGGWNATAVEMVRFLTALDGSRGQPLLKPATFQQMIALPPAPVTVRKDGTHNGLGWPIVTLNKAGFSYAHDGSFHGMRTFMKRSVKGVNWALLFNVSMEPDQVDAALIVQAVQEVRQHVESIEKYPAIDLFPLFP
jgi:N-acyl-D-amino-acid deacylase